MTKKELYKMTFTEAVEELSEEVNEITSYDTLKDFVKLQLEEDNIFLAFHILKAMWEDTTPFDTDYYAYDYSMGTLDTPTPITQLEDLEIYCED